MRQRSPIPDEMFMLECISLAKKGAGFVSPNPMVGAVLVKHGKVIGRGYHRAYGGHHAEVNAISSARSSVAGSTLYCNLEPCNFAGKTPPCTDLIIRSGISRVVIGMKDPNPLVSGKGIRQLRRAGIQVKLGVLAKECRKTNEIFSKYITTGVPYVAIKIAQTLDGKIARPNGNSRWITNQHSRVIVHRLRATYDAIIVGAGTIHADDPSLTVRNVRGRNPIRVIIDGNFSSKIGSKVFLDPTARTIVFISKRSARKQARKKERLERIGVTIIPLATNSTGNISIKSILAELGSMNIASVMVEGGAAVFTQFVREQLADKIYCFVGSKIYGQGLDAFSSLSTGKVGDEIRITDLSLMNVSGDILIEGYLHNRKINGIY